MRKLFLKTMSIAMTAAMVLPTMYAVNPAMAVYAAENDEEDEGEDEGEFDPAAYCAEYGHNLESLQASAGSECGGGVNRDCFHCETCGKYFEDQEATQELNAADVEIPENHSWKEEVKYQWILSDDDGESVVDTTIDDEQTFEEVPSGAIAYHECEKCDKKDIIDAVDPIDGIVVESDSDQEVEDCTQIQGEMTFNVTATFESGTVLKAKVTKKANEAHDFQALSDKRAKDGDQDLVATCTEAGKYYAKCIYCNVISEDIILDSEEEPALGHSYESGKLSDKYAYSGGCTGDYYFLECDKCHEPSEDKVGLLEYPSAKHEGDAVLLDAEGTQRAALVEKGIEVKGKDAVEATCTAEGYSGDKVCDVCGDIMEAGHATEKAAHVYTDKVSDNLAEEADCTHGAKYFMICDNCGEVSETETKEVGEPTGHTFKEMIPSDKIAEEATCDSPAKYFVKCDKCDAVSDTITVEAGQSQGHSYAGKTPSDIVVSEATCTEPAVHYVKCDKCDHVNKALKVKVGDPLGHDTEIVGSKEATCTEKGHSGKTVCKRCKKVLEEGSEIPATGHQHTALVDQKDATCTKDGYTGDTICEDCEQIIKKGEVIKAKGHSFTKTSDKVAEAATCTKPAKHYLACDKCGELSKETVEVGKALGHSWDAGRVTKNPTTTEEGVRTYTCGRCHETRTESIPKIAAPKTIMFKGTRSGSSIKLSWGKVDGAASYRIYKANCGKAFGTKAYKTVSGNSFTVKNIKAKAMLKFYIEAVDKDGKVIVKSLQIHVAGKKAKRTNAKSVSVKKSSVSIGVGGTYKMSNKIIKQDKKKALMNHCSKFRYICSDSSIATVVGGKIVGRKAGSAKIMVIAPNGAYKTIKVTVK